MAEIQSVLKPLEQFETLMKEIYTLLGKRFSTDPDAKAMFARLAFEESSHAGQVQFLRRLARQNPSHFADVDVDVEAINTELRQIEKVTEAASQLSLHEAVVLAIGFENGVAEVHSRPAIAGSNPKVGSLLQGLHSGDLKHYNLLVDFAQKRGFQTARATGPGVVGSGDVKSDGRGQDG
jgi:rubrerythrin